MLPLYLEYPGWLQADCNWSIAKQAQAEAGKAKQCHDQRDKRERDLILPSWVSVTCFREFNGVQHLFRSLMSWLLLMVSVLSSSSCTYPEILQKEEDGDMRSVWNKFKMEQNRASLFVFSLVHSFWNECRADEWVQTFAVLLISQWGTCGPLNGDGLLLLLANMSNGQGWWFLKPNTESPSLPFNWEQGAISA